MTPAPQFPRLPTGRGRFNFNLFLICVVFVAMVAGAVAGLIWLAHLVMK